MQPVRLYSALGEVHVHVHVRGNVKSSMSLKKKRNSLQRGRGSMQRVHAIDFRTTPFKNLRGGVSGRYSIPYFTVTALDSKLKREAT